MGRLSDRGFVSTRGLSKTETGTASAIDALLPLSHGLGQIPNSLELWVEASAGNWEQHDASAYILSTATQLVTTGTTLASVLGGSTNVRLIASSGAVALSVEEASLTKAGIVSTGAQSFAGVKTFASDPTFSSGSQLVTSGSQSFDGAKTFSSVLTSTATGASVFGSDTGAATTGIAINAAAGQTRDLAIYAAGSTQMALRESSSNESFLLTNSKNLYLSTDAATTKHLTIDTSGNVGIGTTSPQTILHINRGTAGAEVLRLQGGTGPFNDPFLSFYKSDGTARNGYIQVSPTDFAIGLNGSGNILFSSNSTERMRIDANGNFLVGTTSSSDNTNGVKISPPSLTQTLKIMKTNTGIQNGILFYQSGVYQGGLNFGSGSTSLATSSDERLKKNIKTAENILNKIQQIQVRSFDWKDYDAKVEYGFVAQELHQVFPEAVNVGKDNEGGSIEMPWSVSSSTLIPHLVKAIQELNAKVEAQAAEIAALKGAN